MYAPGLTRQYAKGGIIIRYILNSAVITAPGLYEYQVIDVERARSWLRFGAWESRVGYAATADYICNVLGLVRCPLSREGVTMQVDDEALIVRLRYRVYDPAMKAGGQITPSLQDWELGILRRVK